MTLPHPRPCPIRNGLRTVLLATALSLPAALPAAETGLRLSSISQDPTLPVNVQSDQLSVSQKDGKALFSGNVRITQGEMTITADQAEVINAADGSTIDRILLTGKVVFQTPTDRAEADEATYLVAQGRIEMAGNVRLIQGGNTVAGSRFTADLNGGTGVMEGGVSTTFTPSGAKGKAP